MESKQNGLRGMMPTKVAADYLGLHIRAIQRLVKGEKIFGKKHKIPHYKIGKRIYFKASDLDSWLEQQRQIPQ